MSGKQWFVYPYTVRLGDPRGYGVRDSEDRTICMGATKEDATAIAAAPDLLEALSDFVDSASLVDPGVYKDAIDQARAAIAKATGGTP
jgi:hypothetical protein